MPLYVIEGTWEEIKRHDAELIGQQVRLTIKPKRPKKHKKDGQAKAKELQGYGMLAGVLSTDDYLRDKREDIIREDISL